MLHAARTARHSLRRAGGVHSFSKTKTHVNAKNSRKVFTTLVDATPIHTHTRMHIVSVDEGVFAFFNYLLRQTQSKFAFALKLIKAAACRALKWGRTHTQLNSALIECICVSVFMTKLGPRWHVQGQVAVKSMLKMRLRS